MGLRREISWLEATSVRFDMRLMQLGPLVEARPGAE